MPTEGTESSLEYPLKSQQASGTSKSVWFMIILGVLLVYVTGIVYMLSIYLKTTDENGVADASMVGESLAVIAIRYGTGVVSKAYDYVTLAGRILSLVGSCIMSLSYYHRRPRLIQTFMLSIGFGCVVTVKPMFYHFRAGTNEDISLAFQVIVCSGYFGWLLISVAVYWGNIFDRITESFWKQVLLNTIVVFGALMLVSSPLIGAYSCSCGGTFLPELILFVLSFWVSFVPVLFVVLNNRFIDRKEEVRFYTPENTPLLPN
jgi:hypothetical protein